MKATVIFLTLALAIAGCTGISGAPNPGNPAERPPWFPEESIFEQTFLRTVKIYADGSSKKASGSGVLIDYRGHRFILTASHVAMPFLQNNSDRESIATGIGQLKTVVQYSDGSRSIPQFSSVLQKADLMILGPVPPEISIPASENLNIESTSLVKSGERIIVWGTPHGYGPAPLIGLYSEDVVLSWGDTGRPLVAPLPEAQSFRTPAATRGVAGFRVAVGGQHGHSGGPAFDFSGRLLGFIHASASDPARAPNVGVIGIHLRMLEITTLLDERIAISYPEQKPLKR